ncbi:MAG: hypothetical protein IBJ03_01130 [Gemmatimonadaceae bacterium]|nr:hypothetical protein [Gemmatimonadaceae bacterium]
MSSEPTTTGSTPVSVHVTGIVRGREVDADGSVLLDAEALILQWPAAAAWRLSLDGLEGVAVHPNALTLYLRDHDVLEFSGDDALRPLALALRDQACRMPELTRGLRDFGLTRVVTQGISDPITKAHDAWFSPLLTARRAVQGVSDPLRQVELMDGASLSKQMLQVLGDLSVQLAPGKPAEQRALEAVMEDEAAPLFEALTRMAIASDALRGGESDTQLADWRRWVEEARRAFAAADEAWGEVVAVLRRA